MFVSIDSDVFVCAVGQATGPEFITALTFWANSLFHYYLVPEYWSSENGAFVCAGYTGFGELLRSSDDYRAPWEPFRLVFVCVSSVGRLFVSYKSFAIYIYI